MKTVILGDTGVQISGICMGTALYGSRIDSSILQKCLDAYFDEGGRFIDTANKYAAWEDGCKGGEAETFIGEWMKKRSNRNKLFIGTKIGYSYGDVPTGLSAQLIEKECEKSLKRLQTDHIDLLYAHCDDRTTPLEETLSAFDRLIKKGHVCHIGCSNTRAWRIAEALKISEQNNFAKYCCIQQRHSYLRPRPSANFGNQPEFANEDLFDFCLERNITPTAYSALLGGCYDGNKKAVPGNYSGPDSNARLKAINGIAETHGLTVNQLVLAWMLNHSPKVIPVTSASKPEQVKINIKAADIELSEDEMKLLNEAGI